VRLITKCLIGFFTLGCLITAQGQEPRLEVKIEPANVALKANVEGYIGNLGERDTDALTQLVPSSKKRAQQALEALGYYQPVIQTKVLPATGKKTPRLQLHIFPGEPVRLRKVHIEINGAASELADFKNSDEEELKSGAVLNHGAYEKAKQKIEQAAQRYGFFRGNFVRQQLLIDPQAKTADIELIYESGPRYLLGDVSFSEVKPLADDFLQRLVPFTSDTPYDTQKIADFYQALQSIGYFDNVQIDALPLPDSERVALKVQIKLKEPRSFGIGAGFSTDVGARGRFNWTRRYRGKEGHSYGLEAELAKPKQNASLWYELPLAAPLSDKLRFAAGYQYEQIADSDSLSHLYKLGSGLQKAWPSDWQQTLALDFRHEQYRHGDTTGISNLLMPSIGFSLLKSDRRFDPANGYHIRFDVAATKKGLLADTDLLHANLSIKGLLTFQMKHRLLARLQLGGSEADDYSTLPSSLRYYAGGDQSVRGYDYQSLAPKNDQKKRVGGRYLMTRSIEYQYSFSEKWRIATFVDQGNAFNERKMPNLKTGAGLGLRWISPLGPLRLDAAHALDENKGFRLHFSMGPEL